MSQSISECSVQVSIPCGSCLEGCEDREDCAISAVRRESKSQGWGQVNFADFAEHVPSYVNHAKEAPASLFEMGIYSSYEVKRDSHSPIDWLE
jgi:hypothetical protein